MPGASLSRGPPMHTAKGPCPCEKACRQVFSVAGIDVDDDMRLGQSLGACERKLGALRHRQPGAIHQHHQAIAVAHIPFGALARVGVRRLA